MNETGSSARREVEAAGKHRISLRRGTVLDKRVE